MRVSEFIARVRAEILKDVTPTAYAYTDVDLVRALVKGLNEFCELTLAISDSTTTAICQISIAIGGSKYALDSRVIGIQKLRLATAKRTVYPLNKEMLDAAFNDWESMTGDVTHYIRDEVDSGYLRIFRTPIATDTAHLTVFRRCLYQFIHQGVEISFDSATKTIASSLGGLSKLGVSAGHKIKAFGSTANSNTFLTVVSATDSAIVVSEALTTEAAGPLVTLINYSGEPDLDQSAHEHMIHGIAAHAYRKQDAEEGDLKNAKTQHELFILAIDQYKRRRARTRGVVEVAVPYGGTQ